MVFQKASEVIIDYSKENLKHSSELAEQSFYSIFKEVSNDIAVIAENPSLQNYINLNSEETKSELEKLFYSTLKNKNDYFQIRFIGVENNGKEIIRYDKSNKGNVVKADTLQEKGDRGYFKETVQINPGEFYFSPISLNEEYGVISKPYIPTLRAASPIYDRENKIRGIVVINVDMRGLYEKFNQISQGSTEFYLVDRTGQYLYSPDEQEQFSLQKNTDHNFFSDYNIALPNQHHFEMVKDGKKSFLTYLKVLTYFRQKDKIYLITTIKRDALISSARAVQIYSLKTLLVVCLLSIIISLIFTRVFSKKINQITTAVLNYENENSEENLPLNRKDEIGLLANSFIRMREKIDHNVKELNLALKKEKQAKTQRDIFLQNMSHELRTPLNSILGFTQILYRKSTTEAQRNIISSLEKSATNLSGLVYDVLDHQKLIEGKLKIMLRPTNVANLIKDIYETYHFETLQKGLRFSINIDQKLEENYYQIDPLRLSQIITNLIVNAIKYTEEGEIVLYSRISNNDSILEIKIRDTGIGILSENINKINDRFFREKDEMNGRFGSYGLGLSIVKQLTHLFKGTLKATSDKGKGSEFCLKIPIKKAPLANKLESKKSNALIPILQNSYRILYIEDDAATSDLITYILESNSIDIIKAAKLENVEKFIVEGNFDLIITDLMIEEVNLKSRLQNWIKTKEISEPLIILSALENEDIMEITPFYFQKPYDVQKVQDLVYYTLGKNEFQVPDFTNIYNNYDFNSEKVFRVLTLLQEEFENYLKHIRNVTDTQNQEEWKAILHKLISNLNNLELLQLKRLLPEQIDDLDIKKLHLIEQHFAFCLCCFRVEKYFKFNLKD